MVGKVVATPTRILLMGEIMGQQMRKEVEHYSAGAVTALSYMAEEGVPKEKVLLVAELMDLNLSDIEDSDLERFVEAYGTNPFDE